MGGGPTRCALWVLTAALAATGSLGIAAPAAAQDALICRKRDAQSGPDAKVIRLGRGDDRYNAGPGPDVIYGGPGDDIVNGGRGDDVVRGGPGRDISCGGVGRDRVFGDAGPDEVFGEEGDDRVVGGAGDDYLAGQAGSDRLISYGFGREGAVPDGRDVLEGSYLSDVLLIGGHDTAYGGDGNDVLRSMTPRVGLRRLDGGPDDDLLEGTNADDRLMVDYRGRTTFRAKGGDDTVVGSFTGGDEIFGGGGDDSLFGVDGPDRIDGGAGTDFCLAAIGGTLGPGCESAQEVDSDEERAQSEDRLDRATAALGSLRKETRRPRAGQLKKALAAERLDLTVSFYASNLEADALMQQFGQSYGLREVHLIVPGKAPARELRARVRPGSFFLVVGLRGHVRCRSAVGPGPRACP